MNERRRFIILTGAVIAGFALLASAVFWPIARHVFAKRNEIKEMGRQLAEKGFESGEAPLLSQKATGEETQKQARKQWAEVKERLRPFSDYYTAQQGAKGVDYLTNVMRERAQLFGRAAAANLKIPYNLGMPDKVQSGDDATTLLMQLKVISTIVQHAADERIGKIVTVEPLPPVSHALGNAGAPYFKEFPVRVECEGEMEPLLRFVHRAINHGQLLTVRGLRFEKMIPEEGAAAQPSSEDNPKVRAVVVLEALVILKDPSEVSTAAPAGKKQQFMPPQGY